MGSLSNRVLVDGFVAITKEWSFLGGGVCFKLPTQVIINNWEPKMVRGLETLKRQQMVQIPICQWKGLSASILITYDDRAPRLEWSRIRKFFVSSVDKGLESLKNTETSSHWICMPKYEDVIGRSGSVQERSLIVFSQDLDKFGQYFLGHFQNVLNTLSCEAWLCCTQLGQIAKISDTKTLLAGFNLDRAHEIVVHLARDFFEDGKCLLWKREGVKSIGGSPKYDFFPCFTCGSGNFVIENELPKMGSMEGNAIPKNIKFYSSAFKQVHRANPKPFKSPIIVPILTNAKLRNVTDQTMMRNLDIVEKSMEEIKSSRKTVARMEVIFSVMAPKKDAFKLCVLEFENVFGPEKEQKLLILDFAMLEKQLDTTIGPIVKTLRRIIETWRQGNTEELVYIPSIATLNLAAVCEMLICFGIYGKVQQGGPRRYAFDRELQRHLKLEASTFRQTSPTFKGLDFTDCVKLQRGRIVYTGPIVLTERVYVDLVSEVGFDTVTDLNRFFNQVLNAEDDDADHAEAYEGIAEVVLQSLLAHCLQKLFPGQSRTNMGMRHLRGRLEECSIVVKSSKEFVAWMFSNPDMKQSSIRQILSAVREFLPTPGLMIFRDVVARCLEKRMYNESFLFLYPVEGGQYLAVLPIHPLHDISFSRLSVEGREQMKRVYMICFEKIYGRGNVPDPTCHLQAAERGTWKSNFRVKSVFAIMSADRSISRLQ